MKPIIITHITILLSILLFWLGMPCNAEGKLPNKKTSIGTSTKDMPVVRIFLGNEAGGWGYEPLQALSAAIVHNAKPRYFRVTWYYNEGSLSSAITALYDRHRKTIQYYCTGGHTIGGNPAEVVYAHYSYLGVTDKMIHQASGFSRGSFSRGSFPDAIQEAPTYEGAGALGGYYDNLLTFGCHRRKLP